MPSFDSHAFESGSIFAKLNPPHEGNPTYQLVLNIGDGPSVVLSGLTRADLAAIVGVCNQADESEAADSGLNLAGLASAAPTLEEEQQIMADHGLVPLTPANLGMPPF